MKFRKMSFTTIESKSSSVPLTSVALLILLIFLMMSSQTTLSWEKSVKTMTKGGDDSDSTRLPVRKEVTLLLSYPNSGTTFTISAVRSISKMTTGTNYFKEALNSNGTRLYPEYGGPYLKTTEKDIPNKLLTKTHCSGYGEKGPIKGYLVGITEFANSCSEVEDKAQKRKKYSSAIAPRTAVRLVRDPFDNVVSNFHHWMHNHMEEGDSMLDIETDEGRFHEYCKRQNKVFDINMKKEKIARFQNEKAQELMKIVPCHQSFFRYAQWHNNANHLKNQMDTLLIHYDEYENDYDRTMDKLIDFLEFENVIDRDKFPEFKTGKTYRNYFSKADLDAASKWLRKYSDDETLSLIKDYLTA